MNINKGKNLLSFFKKQKENQKQNREQKQKDEFRLFGRVNIGVGVKLSKNREIVEMRMDGEDGLGWIRKQSIIQKQISYNRKKGLEDIKQKRRIVWIQIGDSDRKCRNQIIYNNQIIQNRLGLDKQDWIDYEIETEDELEEE